MKLFVSVILTHCLASIMGLQCWAQPTETLIEQSSPSLSQILKSFDGFDSNHDGAAEIGGLQPLFSAPDDVGTDARLLLVMIEKRLLENDANLGRLELVQRLADYRLELTRDGWDPLIVVTRVYDGKIHQDGRTVLAIRRLFQAIKNAHPNFGGAVLIGSFPESMLVRRWVWKHSDRQAIFKGVTYNQGKGPKATFLAMDPELISLRSDVVLCDLNGNWEDIYVQPKIEIDLIKLLPDESIFSQESWPSFDQVITTDKFSIQPKSYEDFFFIDDAKLQIIERTESSLSLKCDYETLCPEVGQSERESANPLAKPDIMVSRINALHAGVVQPAKNLDEQGKPQSVPKSGGSPNRQFIRDLSMERRLLAEYLQRNIDHRRGLTPSGAQQVATVSTDLKTPSATYFSQVAKQLGGIKTFPKATAVDFVRFLKTPAILKGVSAHSNATCSVLLSGYAQDELADETGGAYWFWKKSGDQFVPTYDDPAVRDRVHFSLLRTLWENGKLAETGPCFYIHGGCEAISPIGAATHAYNSPKYGGHNQIAECLLFYGNGLALMGRSKVFYDIPRGFDSAFGVDRGCFGDILKKYFEVEAADANLARDVAGRNRTYFWSIIGDWTLKLNYEKTNE